MKEPIWFHGRGEFAVRGGIIDVYPLTTKNPVRIEFWGDEIDSIRIFDVETQRTIDTIKDISLFPAEEFLIEKESLEKIGDEILKEYPNAIQDVEIIKNGNYLTKIDKYFKFFYQETSTLLDYIGKNTIVFLDEKTRIASKAQAVEFENKEIIEQYIEKYKIVPSYTEAVSKYIDVEAELEKKNIINLEAIDLNTHAKRNGYSFTCREVNFFRGSMDIFVQEVQESREQGKKVLILGGTLSKARGLATMLLEHKINAVFLEQLDENIFNSNKQVIVIPGNLSEGFEYIDLNLIVATGEFTTIKESRRSYKPVAFKQGKKVVFADLNIGDYIVHSVHGIGQYLGIKTLVVDNIKQDYIMLKYRDDAILYIKTNQLDSIRKYMSSSDNPPKLNKMGSKEFTNTKAKVKAQLKDIAKGLIELYAKRKNAVGYSFSKDTVWQTEFEEAFPYQETDDQLRCIEEVKNDMEKSQPMDRLLCGDVGYGKTEVAIRAAFKAVMDGKQVAYLVPTTVLADQQYKSFKERMKDYPIKLDVLNRFKTQKEKSEIIRKANSRRTRHTCWNS